MKKSRFQRKLESSVYKLVLLTILIGCFMLAISIFFITSVTNKTNSLVYLDYLEKEYSLFLEDCNAFLQREDFHNLCANGIKEKAGVWNIRYLLNEIEVKYGSETEAVVTDKEGGVLLSTKEEMLNEHLESFLKAICNNVEISSEPYQSVYYLKGNQTKNVYTVLSKEGFFIHLFMERIGWEKLFPDYEFDGVITGRNKNIVMSSKEVFLEYDSMNKFYIPDTVGKFRKNHSEYIVSTRVLSDGETKIYSMVYYPDNRVVFYIGFVIVIVCGTIWCLMILKVASSIAKKNALASEELIRRNYIAEIRELTAQINPHFMYNTLEMIKYEISEEPKKAKKNIENFTQILRYSIQNTDRDISLEEDMMYIEYYLAIQRERFGERFQVEVDITKEAYRCKVMRLLLQPIIENSIKYGFKKKMELSISIKGEYKKGYLILTVIDNGGGMEEKALKRLREQMETDEITGEHNGIHNTSRRLKLKYKEKSGLKVENFEDGFKVRLFIKQEVGNV